MARIFTIYFEYEDRAFNAMVSVRTTPFFTEYTLNAGDELMQLLPGNKIASKGPGHYVFLNTETIGKTKLMEIIIQAMSRHLHATEA
ncbi:MAG: hypothetical protein ACXWV0_09065 [Flavisolibacter sp.]